MIKEYFSSLFTEGLGDIFFMKYYRYINENVHNELVKKLLIRIYAIIYLLFLVIVAITIFKLSFPL